MGATNWTTDEAEWLVIHVDLEFKARAASDSTDKTYSIKNIVARIVRDFKEQFGHLRPAETDAHFKQRCQRCHTAKVRATYVQRPEETEAERDERMEKIYKVRRDSRPT